MQMAANTKQPMMIPVIVTVLSNWCSSLAKNTIYIILMWWYNDIREYVKSSVNKREIWRFGECNCVSPLLAKRKENNACKKNMRKQSLLKGTDFVNWLLNFTSLCLTSSILIHIWNESSFSLLSGEVKQGLHTNDIAINKVDTESKLSIDSMKCQIELRKVLWRWENNWSWDLGSLCVRNTDPHFIRMRSPGEMG